MSNADKVDQTPDVAPDVDIEIKFNMSATRGGESFYAEWELWAVEIDQLLPLVKNIVLAWRKS